MIILTQKNYNFDEKRYKKEQFRRAVEEAIAQIPADPGTEEYSHLRAAIEKKPSQQAAQINEQYEVQEKAIKKSGVEEKLAGEGKEVVNNETRQKREANLDNRDASLDTLNQFLGGIK